MLVKEVAMGKLAGTAGVMRRLLRGTWPYGAICRWRYDGERVWQSEEPG